MSALVTAPPWPWATADEGGIYGAVLMSNCDHEVNQAVAQQLIDSDVLAEYTGWNFHAVCWHADGQFYAEVSRYHVHRDTLHADTPEELMKMVSQAFGSD